MSYYYTWFIVFVILAYLIVTDQSVARFFVLVSSLAKFQYEKTKWWLLYNPRNPIVKWMMYRRSMKLAEEMLKEMRNEKEI